MYLKYCILILFCSIGCLSINAQSWKKLKTEADEYFQNGKYKEALKKYSEIQDSRPQDMDIKLQIGICYYHTNNISNAKKYLTHIVESGKKAHENAFYYLAKTYHEELQFDLAVNHYKAFLKKVKENHPLRAAVKDDLLRCAYGIRIAYNEQPAIVENLSDKVNTSFDDFGPVLSPNYEDKIYFTSARPGNLGGLRNDKGFKDDRFGNYRTDMYATVVVNGEWTATSPLSSLINSPMNDVILGFNDEGSVMYYFKGQTLFSGEILVDTFYGSDERSLYPDHFNSEMIAENGDGFPHFFNDSVLIFSSRRTGGYGGSDLYISVMRNGIWSKADNLGPEINSPYDETTPFLASDGRTLYFSSNNLKSIGGFDVFKAVFDDNKRSWSTPKNLGTPINSAGDDTFFKLNDSGLKGFFSSSRKSGFGERDLYIAYFKKNQTEQLIQSDPPLFVDVKQDKKNIAHNPESTESPNSKSNMIPDLLPEKKFPEAEIVEHTFSPLYYDSDDRVLSTLNKKELTRVAQLMLDYPQLVILLTSNSDGSVNQKFDLFFSAKRAEQVAEYLAELGVNKSNILIKGCGANYQIAMNQLESGPNPTGQRLNRRIDMTFLNDTGLPLRIIYKEPIVSKHMINENWNEYKLAINGLSYKIQIAAIKQMYTGELITTQPDPMVETSLDADNYIYTVGLYQSFFKAEQMRRELASQGYTDTVVVPYVNGLRLDIEASKIYAAAYPDLKNYIEFVVGE